MRALLLCVVLVGLVAVSGFGLTLGLSGPPRVANHAPPAANRLTPDGGAIWHATSSGIAPGPRYQMGQVTLLDTTGWLVVYGGLSTAGVPLGDTWIYTAGTWLKMATCTGPPCVNPPPMWGASLIQTDATVYMFGGCLTGPSCTSASNSVYVLSQNTASPASSYWVPVCTPAGGWGTGTQPPARYDAAITSNNDLHGFVIFGGYIPGTGGFPAGRGDTWVYAPGVALTGATWSDTCGTGYTFSGAVLTPSPAARGDASFDRVANFAGFSGGADPLIAVLFGGASTGTWYGDTWWFAPSTTAPLGFTWTNLNLARAPSAREGAGFSCDTGLDYWNDCTALLLFGGYVGSPTPTLDSDSWSFAPNFATPPASTWVLLGAPMNPSPGARACFFQQYDYVSTPTAVYVYGGAGSNSPLGSPAPTTVYADEWEYY
jgi:hypothetical protein